MRKRSGLYPRAHVDAAGSGVVSQAGGVLLLETVRASGLDTALTAGLARWRKPTAVHDPAKILLDLAVSLALAGDCLADVAVLRAEPGVYGSVACDPTVSRLVDALAADASRALAAIHAARAVARARVWALAGPSAPDADTDAARPLIVDVDATLVTAHSEKEQARPTFKRGFGFHPLTAFVDHGPDGTGEPLALLLRAGNAGSNTAADHIAVLRDALRQLPGHRSGTRPGRKVLVRADAAGCTHATVAWLHAQRLSYSVGFTLPEHAPDLVALIPDTVWTPAYDSSGEVRPGAWVAELTSLLDLSGWPPGPACDRPQGTAPSRGAAPAHRRRRAPADRVRDQHQGGRARHPAARPRAAAPPPGPRRGPDPLREGHRPDEPAAARLRAEPDLVRPGRPRRRPARLDPAPRPDRARRSPLGTQTSTAATAVRRRLAHSGRRVTLHLARTGPWTQLLLDGLRRLRALPLPAADLPRPLSRRPPHRLRPRNRRPPEARLGLLAHPNGRAALRAAPPTF